MAVAGTTRSSGVEVTTEEMVFTYDDIHDLMTARGITPPDNVSFKVTVKHENGSKAVLGEMVSTDAELTFSYKKTTTS